MSKLIKRLNRELDDIKNNPPMNCSAGLLNENIKEWEATIIGPSDSPYTGGIFKLKILFGDNYPFKPPKVKFVTKIYHPNIDLYGNICLDILKNNWTPALNIIKLLLSICSLLTDPNPNDPLNKMAADLYLKDKGKYNNMVRTYTIQYAN